MGAGVTMLSGQEKEVFPPAGDGGGVESSVSAEEGSPSEASVALKVAESLKELWAAGGETDFSDEAWRARLGLALERWDNVVGNAVGDLTGSEAFYGAATYGEKLSSSAYEPVAPVAEGANGVRFRGVLVIPADGEYSFALAADDSADLYMGEVGGSRFSKKKVLSVLNWMNARDWSQFRTPAKVYKAGDLVWVEVLGKNAYGLQSAEHFSLAWKKPGSAAYELIPAQSETGEVILSTPPREPEDEKDIGVPQSWLGSVGLGSLPAGHPSVRLYGDTDGDGFNLLEEYQTGGRPDEVGGNKGYFSLEKWTGTSEGSVAAFIQSDRFLEAASQSARKEGSLDLAESGDNYFVRLRSQIVPPLSGEWTFYVAGDDSAQLLLSPDGKRFSKQLLGQVDTWTNPREWTKFASQKSDPKSLVAGQSYFLEALQYQVGGGSHLSVAWQYKAPNLCRLEGVSASQSSTYGGLSATDAIDGTLETQAHTNSLSENSWWQVDFPLEQSLNQVVIYNRTDATNGLRLSNFRLSILNASGDEIVGKDFYTESGTYAGATVTWDLPQTVEGKSVRVQGLGINAQGNKYLCLREVEIYEQNEFSRSPVVISGEHVRTLPLEPNDVDNNSLPDDWQREKGLVAGQNGLSAKDCSEYGDPDNDLVSNASEYRLGTHPLIPSGQPGYLTQDMYRDIAGWSVDDAMKSPEVLSKMPQRSLLKNGLSARNLAENYFRRLRGTISPPVSGEYTFWISSDETSILYLSSDERKFQKKEIARVGYGAEDRGVYLTAYNNWDSYPKQRSKPVYLEAGKKYFIEAAHKQYHAIDHLQLAWQIPGGTRELIPGEYMESFGGDLADRDDDDLPDEWEVAYGLSSTDNGGADFNQGAWGDPYQTGVTNREAYLLGWDPRTPSLPDFGDSIVDIPISGGVSNGGMWASVGNALLTPSGRGSLTYQVTIPAKGRYLLEVIATPTGNVLDIETLSFHVQVNGMSLGNNTLRSIRGAAGKVIFLLPELEAGSHQIVLTLKNTDLRRAFALNSLRILKPEGQSADGCEIPEWLHTYLGQENALTNCPAKSLTSPLCVEGKSRVVSLTELIVEGANQKLESGAGTGWYANVDLPEDGRLLSMAAVFESGAHQAQAKVSWQVCSLLLHSQMEVRLNDSLRVSIASEESTEPSLPMTITHNDKPSIETSSDKPVIIKFDTVGTHAVRADWVNAEGVAETKTLTVQVTTVELGEPLDIITGLRRSLTLQNIPDSVLLQNAPPLRVDKSLSATSAGTRRLEVSSEQGGAQHLVARLREAGPILDSLALFAHTNSSTSTLSRVEPVMDYGDGSSLMCLYLASESLPQGGYVKITLTAAGVQFLAGGTELIVRAEDFGADGLYRLLMTVPGGTMTSVCHIIRYYDKDGREL